MWGYEIQRLRTAVCDAFAEHDERLKRLEAAGPKAPHGCICPPASEATCRGQSCPRQSLKMVAT